MAELERDVLYEDSDFEIDIDDEADLPYLPYKVKSNYSSRSPDSFATFLREAWHKSQSFENL